MGASAPSAEPVEAAGTFLLLSFHGTLLGYQRSRRALCQRDFSVADPDRLPLRLAPAPAGGLTALLPLSEEADRAGPVAALAGFSLGPGLYPGSLHLRRGGLYLSAERNGGITIAAPQCLGWESFLPLPVENVALLRHILSSCWTLPNAPAPISPELLSLGPKFTLRFGDFDIDLWSALPNAEDGSHDRLILRPKPGTGTITATRAHPVRRRAAAPKVWIHPQGNMANRALQYLTAEAIRAELPDLAIENVRLVDFGRDTPMPAPPPATAARTGEHRHRIDIPGLADCLRRGVVDAVIIDGYPYNIDQYPPRQVSRQLLKDTPGGADARGFGPRELVCAVRAGEILDGIHQDYLPLPPGYYRMLQERTGLDLVFFGQLGDDLYSQSLREAFPRARFIPGRNPGYDFDTLRRSVHVASAISTFTWLAAWLGEPETVILPVGGMFNPVQHPDQMHLPFDDLAYQFVLLPYAKMFDVRIDPPRFARQQALLAQYARFAEPAEIKALWSRAEMLGRGRALVGGFDPEFYAARYPDVAEAEAAGRSVLDHYLERGAAEGRLPLDFDPLFYIERYPEAAMEIASCLHPTPLRHFMAVGWRRGYEPKASAMSAPPRGKRGWVSG